ncbi:hypothetical protein BC332_18778 [Capsicum chinense]|uniref:Methionyl-tRNA synthetase n=1 Tax=Capsicum annuum TaxID=4072 RepID=A0A2G3A2A9_CAPAN|nr:uncharacterized protein LOC124896797 [Capsicum annuum]PHT88373.1 hypothetical protein T459_10479 [Capsicum annuum]PHU11848.1 hypothetical protein BC332_18778 [Capsicum chinense]
MCLIIYVCDAEEKELGRQAASGACPSCGGKVQAVDVESRWKFCFLPLCFIIKRKYQCTLCSRRLVLYSS